MSNKPAPRCPGCGEEMELTEVMMHIWRYSCEDCGWRSHAVYGSGKEGKGAAYDKAMKRYKPVYDGYQGTAHEQGWPDQRAQTLHGGGELNFDVPPGRYPMVCQSTRRIKPPKEGDDMDGDLISRKTLMEILNAKSDMEIATPAQMIYANVAKIVELQPAVDAEPVMHGRWRHLGGDEWRCTTCGEVIHTEGTEKPEDKYCRECGAMMDGGEEDGHRNS